MLDGVLARKYKSETVIGKFLDPLADKLLVTSVLIMLVFLGRLATYDPLFPIFVVATTVREIFITGIRAIARDNGLVIAAGSLGKKKTWCQMFAIGFLVLPAPIGIIQPHLIGFALFILSLFFSLLSAYQYTAEFWKQLKLKK